jgi:hypothetical protein
MMEHRVVSGTGDKLVGSSGGSLGDTNMSGSAVLVQHWDK